MAIRAGEILPRFGTQFLAHCYKFVAVDWQHASRDSSLLDQGFERQFREACIGQASSELERLSTSRDAIGIWSRYSVGSVARGRYCRPPFRR
jgi:hypothetical protein